MPPPPLHPRSLTTSTLFTTIALLSFLIVGAPHVLPCPAGVNRLDQRRAKVGGSNDAGGRKRKCPGLVGAVLGRREEGEGEGGRRVVLEGKK